jgi:hypothetical protein
MPDHEIDSSDTSTLLGLRVGPEPDWRDLETDQFGINVGTTDERE